ncbi:RNA polymerase factor sigma-70 [Lysinibacillus contaminans]|uniref:RNA polymerase factor sigma-70 n=1 Tax=Lysinibacillus contaminans TaxID=1293441 RepID=A0ABR5K3J8_9BACI|nr:sigma-70 family RNA polymerase sigma factor [Lysinibacillus contaminans]KOS69240.1 RNA polymerase factor sigma-70 [Lysinibacillus contaminans]
MKSNDRNFIKRLKRQEEDALEYVVDHYLPLVKGVVYKVLTPLQQESLLEECMNDVFLSIWENIDQFKGDAIDFRKWVCVIAKYKAIDYYRKAGKSMEVSSEHTGLLVEDSVEEALIQIENHEELLQLINRLDAMDREIFMMKFFLGVKTEDIAARFGLTRAAIDNRIYRGKKKLQQQAMDMKLGGSLV